MATVQIRVSEETRDRLQRLADTQHQSVGAIVQQAVERLDDALFWSMFHEQLDAIRTDPKAWAEMNDELHAFDGTLLDGLRDEGNE